jgi:hypothetical protein
MEILIADFIKWIGASSLLGKAWAAFLGRLYDSLGGFKGLQN